MEDYTPPKQGLVIQPVEVGGNQLVPDTYVWILGADGVYARVEYRDRVGTIPRAAVVETPVPAPPLERLRELDPCFGLQDGSFEGQVVNHDWMYRIFRCKAHGRHFLGDVRGGIGMYERVTLLEPGEEASPETAWNRYHAMSDDWLCLLGRSR